jgi:hypothetical protein
MQSMLHSTQALLEQYLDGHLTTPTGAPPVHESSSAAFVQFRVGPFQFVLKASAVIELPQWGARCIQVEVCELVPERYRAKLDQAALGGPDRLMLKGGRIAITGCTRGGELRIPEGEIITRGLRPDTPWIMGSIQQPPSFVLDSDALQLHFGRRVES